MTIATYSNEDKGSTKSEVIYTAERPSSSLQWHVYPLVTRHGKGAAVTLGF